MTLREPEPHIIDGNETFGPPDLDDCTPTESTTLDSEIHDPHSPKRRSGGPRTPEGKAVSSQNATKHGCRSKTLILPHEDPAEYEALHKKWWDEYQPCGHIEETLVQQLIDNHWYLKRASLRLEQVEWEMPMNAKHWIESYQKEVGIFTRYKTAAERAFYKSFHEVEAYLRKCVRDENAAHKADLLRLKIEAQIAGKPAEAKQIALKMAIPLYRDRRDRAAARAKFHPAPDTPPPSSSPGP